MMMRERIPAIANAIATMRNMPNGDAVSKPNGPPGSLSAAGLDLVFCASPCANSATCESATCCCRVESACVSSGAATAPSRLRTPTCGAGVGHFTVADGDGATCCAAFCKLPSAVGTTCISGEELAAATSDAGAEIDLAGGAGSVDSLRCLLLRRFARRAQVPALLLCRPIRAVVPVTALRRTRVGRAETILCGACSTALQASTCDQQGGDECD